ncbi:MAG: ribonuclease D [Anaerolineales bacterium]|nr:ribonuclease D [Anaerolineales bacterium]
MHTIELPDPLLITRSADLRELAERLLGQRLLAVDTESNSLYAYRERVCLIQFSTPEADYMLDPLALPDLSPLAAVFSAPAIEKIFHAAEYDLICLRRDFGFEFANLFDTMAAARILGRKAVGLGSILADEFGVNLEKRHQRADWGQRPLPSHMLKYARLDTHYLIELRQRLKAELLRRDLMALAEEDFKRLSLIHNHRDDYQTVEERSLNPWRISGASDLAPRQAAVLQELCRYRDQVARSIDQPLFKVISDQTLLAIAQRTPGNLDELGRLVGMRPKQVRRHGERLLRAVQRGLQAAPIYPPRSPRPDNGFLMRLEALRDWRKQAARRMGVPSDVVLPRDLMLELVERNPGNSLELAQALADVPWRLQHFGDEIIEALENGSLG